MLQGLRDGHDDHLADLGDGDDDVDQAAQEYHAHGLLPAEAEAEAHGVGEERVEAHAGGLGVRPARISVETVVPFSFKWKNFSIYSLLPWVVRGHTPPVGDPVGPGENCDSP